MGTSGQASSLDWRNILRERDRFGGEYVVNGKELAWGKLVCGVMQQKIAVEVVC